MLNEKERIMNYIIDNFNVNNMSYNLINELYDYIIVKWCGKEYIKVNGIPCKINGYIKEFIEKMNNCNIDITLKELIENKVIDIF